MSLCSVYSNIIFKHFFMKTRNSSICQTDVVVRCAWSFIVYIKFKMVKLTDK